MKLKKLKIETQVQVWVDLWDQLGEAVEDRAYKQVLESPDISACWNLQEIPLQLGVHCEANKL